MFIVFASCSNGNKHSDDYLDKTIVFPDDLEIYNSILQKSDFLSGSKSSQLKIFTVINVSCATCILKLDKWESFLSEMKECSRKVLLIPVCTSEDKFEMIKFLFENNRVGKVSYPLLLDSTGSFIKLNKQQFTDDMQGIAVLTNSDNKVLLTGNPIEDKADKLKFVSEMCGQ